MAVIRVTPLPDGAGMRGNWQVKKNGRQISTHVKKSAAKRKTRKEAGPEDSVVLHRVDGTAMPK